MAYSTETLYLAHLYLDDQEQFIDSREATEARLAIRIQDVIDDFIDDSDNFIVPYEVRKDAAAEQKGDIQRDNGRTR